MKTEIAHEAPMDHCANCHSANLSAMLNAYIQCKQYGQQSSGFRSATRNEVLAREPRDTTTVPKSACVPTAGATCTSASWHVSPS